MPPSMWLKNPSDLHQAFMRLDKLSQQRNLEAAVLAGLQPINNATQEKAPYRTGTLRRSYHTEILQSSPKRVEGGCGTNLNYARRVELGYNDTDALGRTYHQPAKPHLRPAFDENRGKAVAEMGESLKDILMALI